MIKGLKGFFEEDVKKTQAVDENGNPVEADVVDKDGKPIKENTIWGKIKKGAKIVFGVAVVTTGAVAAEKFGETRMSKIKDKEIRDLTQRNADLSEENDSLWQEREHLLHPETEETPVTTKEEVETTEF